MFYPNKGRIIRGYSYKYDLANECGARMCTRAHACSGNSMLL